MGTSASSEKARKLTNKVTALRTAQQPAWAAPRAMTEIRVFNDESKAYEELWARTRQAADMVKQTAADAQNADSDLQEAERVHKTAQAENPERSSPRSRQWLFAGGTLSLDGVACYFAAEALGADQLQTVAWTALFLILLAVGEFALDHFRDGNHTLWWGVAAVLGAFVALLGVLRFSFLVTVGTEGVIAAMTGAALFTVITASFVILGYRTLRVAESGAASKARRMVKRCARAAAMAHRRHEHQIATRDRLARAYLSRIRTRLVRTCSVSQLQAMEQAVWTHLVGEDVS